MDAKPFLKLNFAMMKSLDMHKIEKEGKLQNLETNKQTNSKKEDNLKCKFAS